MTTLTTASVPLEAADDQPSGLAVWTRGLTKRYGDRTVVDRVGLEVLTGVVCGFVGPNGTAELRDAPAGGTSVVLTLPGHHRPPPRDQGIQRDQGK
jgi:hypothetical protein